MYIEKIDSPEDLKKLKTTDLPAVCQELRNYIIEQLAHNPGHLGASLGVVELTVAIHYVFDTPYDRVVWDVGHQAYAHKILTGRREAFKTNRMFKGISGFPLPKESEYDSFGTGHSSTSISAALGMAIATKLKGEKRRQVVAVIGDGALTGGLAYEGINNASTNDNDLLIVLNDNHMAIDPIRGGMSKFLTSIHLSHKYNRLRWLGYRLLDKVGLMDEAKRNKAIRFGNSLKGLHTADTGNNVFEGLNIRYFGPVDGHDVEALVKTLRELKRHRGAKVLHIITQKGKGYEPAERNETIWHAPGEFDVRTGERIKKEKGATPPKFQDVFGNTLLELAEQDERIVGITPAMPSGCSMNIMMKAMPDRTFDVGIAEGHAVTFAAGLAKEGLIPFCNIYSSFMQRAYDGVIHDTALQGLKVIFCLDRAGIVGNDGATHHGMFDIAMFRPVPNLTIAAPRNEHELRDLMLTAVRSDCGPWVIRYPRGNGSLTDWHNEMKVVEIGRGDRLRNGRGTCIVGVGPLLLTALRAAERFEDKEIAVYDLRFVKPLDEELLKEVGERFETVFTIEDGVVAGGVGSAVGEWMNDHGYRPRIHRLGIPDTFVEHGSPAELYHMLKLDEEGIYNSIRSLAISH
ncbi:MAG: 1-deoxy-D-xylulose-5-phosphate synthase [Paludibacteraceae bacterium]|nr:1-deoxy-D-xylulose-5-phosphate synthase [Paludibacteraceae bacterium]